MGPPRSSGARKVCLVDAAREDLEQISKWLSAAHVREWWGEPDEIWPELDAAIPSRGHAMIEVDGRKVGFVLYAQPSREELDDAGLHDVPVESIDLDLFIGEPTLVGHGIGRRTLELAVARIFEDANVSLIIAATSAHNTAAIRCAQRAGFDVSRRFNDADGAAYVLGTMRRA